MLKTVTTPFHLVKSSFWPILVSIFSFTSFLYIILLMHYPIKDCKFVMLIMCFFLLWTLGSWWFDICIEGFRGGYHTKKVRSGLRLAVSIFIISELMFFFSFFWAFFSASLAPVYNIGCVWPPVGINVISPWGIPLLNTFILLLSGATITKAHHALQKNYNHDIIVSNFSYTLILAILFTKLQLYEYTESNFTISDSIYGSLFFVMTGFHGIHVIVGTCFIFVCFFRYESDHFSSLYHFGFEAAIWYWHFVDVVWIFLFFCLYWWGG